VSNNVVWGSTFPRSRKILAKILKGVTQDEKAEPVPDHDPSIAGSNTARVPFDVARLTAPG
jgi:hypothetical protein